MDSIQQTFAKALAGRVALVVGGTSGIGAAIALALSAAGAAVTVTGATDTEVERSRTGALGALAARRLDVSDGQMVKACVGGFVRLDVLVNCAGVLRRGAEHEPEVFEQVIDINLTGTMRCCAAARPLLAQQGGCIVNIASMLSFFGGGLVPGYSASKGGVAQLTKSLAIAYAADKIRVNAVAPGWIATQLTDALREDEARNRVILERTPMRRWGQPDDIAGAVVFLCTPAAAFITGVVLPVDGGYLIS
ncbi:MAG TPA: SDR family oxidoreductase [Burkholderiales bacterium]|nr:SDR family oxidoreductase [Burkholderiales bacterium]